MNEWEIATLTHFIYFNNEPIISVENRIINEVIMHSF